VGSKIPLVLIIVGGDMHYKGYKIKQQYQWAGNPENLFPHDRLQQNLRSLLVEKTEPYNGKYGGKTIPPADLFTFLIRSAAIADRHFINSKTFFGDFHGEFGFKTEAILFDPNIIEHLFFEHLVTGFHIRQVQVA
jgi:hypothetical protein